MLLKDLEIGVVLIDSSQQSVVLILFEANTHKFLAAECANRLGLGSLHRGSIRMDSSTSTSCVALDTSSLSKYLKKGRWQRPPLYLLVLLLDAVFLGDGHLDQVCHV